MARRKALPMILTPYPDEVQQLALYRQAGTGWVLAERYPTFVGQFAYWIRQSLAPSPVPHLTARPGVQVKFERVFPDDSEMRKTYKEARLADVFGDTEEAIRLYHRAAELARLAHAPLAEKAALFFIMLKSAKS